MTVVESYLNFEYYFGSGWKVPLHNRVRDVLKLKHFVTNLSAVDRYQNGLSLATVIS